MAIPAAPVSTVVQTDLSPTDVTTMTSRVDEDGARRIMGMLVDMYADRETAVVREYVANAVDATTAAGSRLPVEVTTPDELTPNLVITDRGTGMSAAEVEAVFLAFAASTKRDTNDQVGGLGVGAKSAWTVADSFVIDTVKAGRRTVVRAARDLAHQVLVADAPTDLPSGTSITIPVDAAAVPRWREVIGSVTRAHKPGMVVVDGVLVESIQGGPRWVGPVRCGQLDEKHPVTVLSGGTLFAVPDEIAIEIEAAVDLTCILELPIGSFDHTPSRESLIATDRTKNAIRQALDEFGQKWAALAEQITTLAATDAAAAQSLRAATLSGDGNPSHLPITASFALSQDFLVFRRVSSTSTRMSWTPPVADKAQALCHFVKWAKTLLVVTDWPEKRTLRGVATYASVFAPSAMSILALRGQALEVALPVTYTDQVITVGVHTPGVTVVSYAEMQRQLAERRAATQPSRSNPSYEVEVKRHGAVKDGTMTLSELAASTEPVIYHDADLHGFPLGLDDGVLVHLGRRSAARLTAAVPGAIAYSAWQSNYIRELAATVTDLDLEAAVATAGGVYPGPIEMPLRRVAETLLNYIPATRPAATILRRIVDIDARIEATDPRERATLEALVQARRAYKAQEFIDAQARLKRLSDSLRAMYPLVFDALYRQPRLSADYVAHLGEYLANVEPKTTATATQTAA